MNNGIAQQESLDKVVWLAKESLDKVVWLVNEGGVYSVKFAYQVLHLSTPSAYSRAMKILFWKEVSSYPHFCVPYVIRERKAHMY